MKIENKKLAGIIRLTYMFIPLFFTALISASYFFKSFPNYTYFAILAIIFITILIITNKIKLYYLQISDEAGKITLRYLTLGPIGGNRKSIEMPHKDFLNFQINISFYGYKKEITLYRHTPKGTAKYPPVSISSLSKAEIIRLKNMLKNLIKKNRKR